MSFISTLDTSPIAFKHPTVSIVVTKYAGKNAINAFKSNVTPYSNILGIDTKLASLTAEKSTNPKGMHIKYPTTIPISIDALLKIPFPYLFKNNVIIITNIDIDTFSKLPYESDPTPPAAQSIETGIKVSPIKHTTVPVTIGGNNFIKGFIK